MAAFLLWINLDAASHWYFGHNFDYAMWTGKYFLGWGLYGQAQLAGETLMEYSQIIFEKYQTGELVLPFLQ
jgi:hypothetical protein